MKYISTSTTYINPLIFILFCGSKPIISFYIIKIYGFNHLDTILSPSAKFITRNRGNSLVRLQAAEYF